MADAARKIDASEPIGDSSPWCLPEKLTHLYYSPIYPSLTERQRRTYNRLHACYLCEFYVFFEELFPGYYARAAVAPGIDEPLRAQLRSLVTDEKRHGAMFRNLARQLAPERYDPFRCHFIRVPSWGERLLALQFRFPAFFPAILWIALIQEERALYYAQEIEDSAGCVEHCVVKAHRAHVQDEQGHLAVEEALLHIFWDGCAPGVRRINGRLLRWAFKEFLIAPKRGGMRLIERFVAECPELAGRALELKAAMRALENSPAFHDSLYSRTIVPRTFALFDRYDEFRDLGDVLPAYMPEAGS